VGYRILAINGESLYNKTLREALQLLYSAGDTVTLKISKATRKNRELLGRRVSNVMYMGALLIEAWSTVCISYVRGIHMYLKVLNCMVVYLVRDHFS